MSKENPKQTKLTPELKAKIEKKEVLEPEEIGLVQRANMDFVSNQFLSGENQKDFEMIFRNPAVFFSSISQDEFNHLPEPARNGAELVADIIEALHKSFFGPEFEKHAPHRNEDDAHPVVGDWMMAMQVFMRDGYAKHIDPLYVALIAKEIAAAFDIAWGRATRTDWHETTDPSRISYYSGNAIAGAHDITRSQK